MLEVVVVVPVTIGSNIASLKATRQLDRSAEGLRATFERLSSGQRINKASDDAAGLAISMSLNARSRVYSTAIRNINDGISAISIASSAVDELKNITTRQAELAEQASQGVLSGSQRLSLQREANSLVKEYNRILQSTEFNGRKLIDGTDSSVRLQLGFGTEESLVAGFGDALGARAGTGIGSDFTVSGANAGGGRTIAVGDLNNDGNLDFVNGGFSSFAVRMGNGQGGFSSAADVAIAGGSGFQPLGELVIKDVNNDGFADVVSGSDDGSINVSIGRGNGSFNTAVTYDLGIGGVFPLVGDIDLRDLNNDGYIDAVATSSDLPGTTSGVAVLMGQANGRFGPSTIIRQGGLSMQSVIADFDGNGTLDILGGTGDSLVLQRGNGNGTFGTAVTVAASFGGSQANGLETGDFNGDGAADLVVSTYNGGAFIYRGNGNGTFARAQTFALPGVGSEAGVADINGDGYLDVAIAHSYSHGVTISLGRGDGTFGATTSFGSANEATDVGFGDFNSDGSLDLIVDDQASIAFNKVDPTGRRSPWMYDYDFLSIESAREGLTRSQRYLDKLNIETGNLGAYESRLRSALNTVTQRTTGYLEADSRIKDIDVAQESSELIRQQILQKVASSVLAQANTSPEIALQLLS